MRGFTVTSVSFLVVAYLILRLVIQLLLVSDDAQLLAFVTEQFVSMLLLAIIAFVAALFVELTVFRQPLYWRLVTGIQQIVWLGRRKPIFRRKNGRWVSDDGPLKRLEFSRSLLIWHVVAAVVIIVLLESFEVVS